MICKLALEDGTVFTGVGFGASGTRTGEVVFNTSMTGYQEIFTDPSYCGQIVTMTFPLIGNYGVNCEDFESSQPFLSGFVIKELSPRPSNYRATAALEEFLAERNIIGLCGIDTRALTRRIRIHGALRGALSTEILDAMELVTLAAGSESMVGANLVPAVTSHSLHEWSESVWAPDRGSNGSKPATCHIVAMDCGIKYNILRSLVHAGCRVTVTPAAWTAEQILALAPDGIVVGNGPGDPAAATDAILALSGLLGQVPILGVCLGHQMLALAMGAKTYKLRFGHHGANVPVLNQPAGRVEITSQNHGFAVDTKSLERLGAVVTHVNLNDGSLEGFAHPGHRVMAVQFHPEASPGPHDSSYIFDRFVAAVVTGEPIGPDLLRS